MLYTIPNLQIRTSTAIIYNEYVSTKTKIPHERSLKALKEAKKYTGTVTECARKRIRKAVTLLLQSTEKKYIYNVVTNKKMLFHIAFVTLTIPAIEAVEAKKAHKELLEPFLRWLRCTHSMKSYIWKAELQERGQLHYHLTIDTYVHYQELRNKWNRLLSKAGLNKEYVREHGHDNANSTDIHSIKNVKRIDAYLTKYLSKTDQNDVPINAKVWDCSVNLKKCKYYTTTADSYTCSKMEEAIAKGELTVRHEERFSIISSTGKSMYSYLPADVKHHFQDYMRNVRDYERIGTGLFSG